MSQVNREIEEIVDQVASEFQMGGLSDGVYLDFATEVAKRYAARKDKSSEPSISKPKNKMHAYAFQFEETVKVLISLSMLGDKPAFDKHLEVLKTQIESYE